MPTQTEAGFTATVIQLAKLKGWRVAHFRPALTLGGKWRTPCQGDAKGFVDLVLVRGGRLIFAELKRDGATTTPEQDSWLAALAGAGADAVVWRPSDWKTIEAALE